MRMDFPSKNSCGMPSSPPAVRKTELLRLLAALLDELLVRTEVYGRAFAFAQPGLENEKTDQRLSLTGMQLNDYVAICAPRFEPFTEDMILRLAKRSLIACTVEAIVDGARINCLLNDLFPKALREIYHEVMEPGCMAWGVAYLTC